MSPLIASVQDFSMPSGPLISTYSRNAVGPTVCAIGGGGGASATWPTANKAFYIPFFLYQPELVTRVFVINGSTASGNWDVGVYNDAGARLVSSGATAQSGTTTIQFADVTDTLLPAGAYYMGCSFSGTTGTAIRLAWSNLTYGRGAGCKVQTSAHALPASATFALVDTTFLPLFGVALRSSP